jgi:hypothetical protein
VTYGIAGVAFVFALMATRWAKGSNKKTTR